MRRVYLPCYGSEEINQFKKMFNVNEQEVVQYATTHDLPGLIESSQTSSEREDRDLLLISLLPDALVIPDLYKKITNSNIPTLILTPPEQFSSVVRAVKYHPLVEVFNICYGPRELHHTIGRLISIVERTHGIGRGPNEFVLVNKNQINQLEHYPTDIYLRLSRSKIVKVFKRDDEIDIAKVNKYAQSNEAELIVKKAEYHAYLDSLQSKMKDQARELKSLSFNQKLMLSINECEFIARILPFFQVDQKFLGVMNELLNHVFDLAKGTFNLPQLFGKKGFITGKDKRLATALTATIIARENIYASQNELGKLIVASFFCDISLDQSHTKHMNLEDIGPFSYLKQAKLKLINHPFESVELISKFVNMNLDASVIIREHHELPDGSGYPKQLQEADLHPLSSIFILASFIVDFISEYSAQVNSPEELLTACEKRFAPHFPHLLASLESVLSIAPTKTPLNKVS